jgi:hypothetical protein
VQASDTTNSIAQSVANLIANSNACVGPSAFLQPPSTASNSLQLSSILAPGTQITFSVTLNAGAQLTVSPVGTVNLQQNGDTMTFYYSSTGKFLMFPNDTPGIPPQLHMAPVHGLLSEYWCRKNDPTGNADRYYAHYDRAVVIAKELDWDAEKSIQPSMYSDYEDELDSLSVL